MTIPFTQAELEAYLDEDLAPEHMADVEKAVRSDERLAKMLVAINSRRDAGLHSLGAIWRRHRISCPSREHLGSYLLSALSEEQMKYITFHIQTVGCRPCRANLEDLDRQQEESSETAVHRRRKFFQTSAGFLRQD